MFHLKGENDYELQHKNYIDLSLNQGHHITNIRGTIDKQVFTKFLQKYHSIK